MSGARPPRGETAQLTGYLYEALVRGRSDDDYAMSGHVRVAGIDYQVRCYLEHVRGTARKRWRIKLRPIAPREAGPR